jgi:gamma-glutamyl:cysteine ligase YbdK (ATP-grasp superfamily)
MFGPELEFVTVDRDYKPIDAHGILERSDYYGKNIKRELAKEQVEIFVGPSKHLNVLYNGAKRVVGDAIRLCKKEGVRLLPVAFYQNHELMSLSEGERFEKVLKCFGSKGREYAFPLNGDQINIGARSDEEALEIHNRFRVLLPYIVGLGVSSPFRDGELTRIKSQRIASLDKIISNFSKDSPFPRRFDSMRDYEKDVERNSAEGDPSIYYPYVRMKPEDGIAAEIRALDKQPSLKETFGFFALCKGLMDYDTSEIERTRDLEEEFDRSVREGVFDMEFARGLVKYAMKHLPDSERKLLTPLSRKIQVGTPADVMGAMVGEGKSLNEIYERLIQCNEKDEIFL